jgi:hypothetical protein
MLSKGCGFRLVACGQSVAHATHLGIARTLSRMNWNDLFDVLVWWGLLFFVMAFVVFMSLPLRRRKS